MLSGCVDEAVVELFVYVSLDGGHLFFEWFSGGRLLQVVIQLLGKGGLEMCKLSS